MLWHNIVSFLVNGEKHRGYLREAYVNGSRFPPLQFMAW